jgi:VIT1/CCC1 family predicted Fe2+/Mn2+ transporter
MAAGPLEQGGGGQTRGWLDRFDAAAARERVTDVNDGVLSLAGLSEGLSAAHAQPATVLLVIVVSTVAGAIALASAKLGEGLADREAQQRVVAEERRLLKLSPAEEVAELAQHFEAKGVSPETARQVAEELSAADALSAQLEIEHGILELASASGASRNAFWSGVAFLLGAAGPVAIAYLSPGQWLAEYTLAAALIWLSATSLVLARLGQTRVLYTLLRSLLIGLTSLGASYVLASLLF